MDKQELRKQALAQVKHVEWKPEWGEARIEGMIENRPDWCISRQRTWGVPIALFTHRQTDELHPDTAHLIEVVAEHIEKDGVDIWYDIEPTDLLGDTAADYEKVTDTLDVWFDSGVTHNCVLAKRAGLHYPADLYLEGSDQHRGWFQSSLLTAIAMRGSPPYKEVLTHGFTVDAHGQKMSKSLGNVIAPQKVVNSLGADVLRLWVAATDYSGEMAVSNEILKRMADAYRRIRNTARFLLANLHGFDPTNDMLPREEMLALDRWAVDQALRLQNTMVQAYDDYAFHQIYQKIHNFCAVDMGGFYLDVIKDRQYTTQTHSVARRSAQSAMYHIVEALARWLAPILSFTADEIWQHIPGKREDSVFLTTWYDGLFALDSTAAFDHDTWSILIEIREAVSKELERLRVEAKIGASLDAEVDISCQRDIYDLLGRLEDELRFVLITSYARAHPADKRPDNATDYTLSNGNVVSITATASALEKCIRCWHRREDVGLQPEHPKICGRCAENVVGHGEQRKYA